MTFFVVIDPVGLLPLFISLTGKYPPEEQNRIARRAVLVAAVILLVFSFTGNLLLRYLGISFEAFEIAAGLLLLKIGVDMVFAQQERETPEEEQEAQQREDVSVFPLAIPLLAGPGTLASLLIFTSEVDGDRLGFALILGVVALVLLLTYGLFGLATWLAKVFGRTGINVVTRVLGVLLAALAVQYIASGTSDVLKSALVTDNPVTYGDVEIHYTLRPRPPAAPTPGPSEAKPATEGRSSWKLDLPTP
ncbi:MarC family protein [Leptolyngbya sp. PL-A3]